MKPYFNKVSWGEWGKGVWVWLKKPIKIAIKPVGSNPFSEASHDICQFLLVEDRSQRTGLWNVRKVTTWRCRCIETKNELSNGMMSSRWDIITQQCFRSIFSRQGPRVCWMLDLFRCGEIHSPRSAQVVRRRSRSDSQWGTTGTTGTTGTNRDRPGGPRGQSALLIGATCNLKSIPNARSMLYIYILQLYIYIYINTDRNVDINIHRQIDR